MENRVESQAETELAAERIASSAIERLALSLAAYLAAGSHHPAENGRQAVIGFLQKMADTPFGAEVERLDESRSDEAKSLALTRIGKVVEDIRRAAALV